MRGVHHQHGVELEAHRARLDVAHAREHERGEQLTVTQPAPDARGDFFDELVARRVFQQAYQVARSPGSNATGPLLTSAAERRGRRARKSRPAAVAVPARVDWRNARRGSNRFMAGNSWVSGTPRTSRRPEAVASRVVNRISFTKRRPSLRCART